MKIFRSFVPEDTGAGMAVRIEMDVLPTLRYQRNLLRTNLDFVGKSTELLA